MTVIDKLTLKVSTDFSFTPGPRYEQEGKFSGEVFRKDFLEPKLKEAIKRQVKLFIDFDGTAGYGTSFLEEAFGGLIRVNKYSYEEIFNHIELKSNEEDYLIDDIKGYLKDAANK